MHKVAEPQNGYNDDSKELKVSPEKCIRGMLGATRREGSKDLELEKTYNPSRVKRQDIINFFDCRICSFQIEYRTRRLKFVKMLKAALIRENTYVSIQVPSATISQAS